MIDASTAARELSAIAVAAKKQRKPDMLTRLDSIEKELDIHLGGVPRTGTQKIVTLTPFGETDPAIRLRKSSVEKEAGTGRSQSVVRHLAFTTSPSTASTGLFQSRGSELYAKCVVPNRVSRRVVISRSRNLRQSRARRTADWCVLTESQPSLKLWLQR